MTDATWNDGTRDDLRKRLQDMVLGETRLSKYDAEDILQFCREVYIADTCPEDEMDQFVHFAEDELEKAKARHAIEQLSWPAETDCDRLDQVEATLRDRGILLWQASPCCDSCTIGELFDRVEVINKSYPGFMKKIRGYAFFIDQNKAEMLAEDTNISIYLGYGWCSPNDQKVPEAICESNALSIAREVCHGLSEHGFTPDWDGSFSKKIGISLNWQRRTMLS